MLQSCAKKFFLRTFFYSDNSFLAKGKIIGKICFCMLSIVICSPERDVAQRRKACDEVSKIITACNTDDQLSRDQENAITQLSSSILPAVDSAFIARERSDKDESDNESIGNTSQEDATACDVTGRKETI